jgi:hypothetical protein
MKRRKYLILFTIVLSLLFIGFYNFKNLSFRYAISKNTSGSIRNFEYYDGYKFEDKNFFLTEFMEDTNYCYGVQTYSYRLGVFYDFSHPNNYSGRCYSGSKDEELNTVYPSHEVFYDQSGNITKLGLQVFGVNKDTRYSELIIKYVWSEELTITITDDPLFFYYKEISFPEGFLKQITTDDFFEFEYIER